MRLIAFAITMSFSGCATYRQRVGNDFRDAVKLNVGTGLGFYVHGKATSFLDGGLGWGGYWCNIGLENRYTRFVHPSLTGCNFPLGIIPGALPDEPLSAGWRLANTRGTGRTDMKGEDYVVVGQLFDGKAVTKWDAYGVTKRKPHQVSKNVGPSYTEQPLGFEAGAGLVFFNANAGFDPVEFCDLLCTLCGWDLLHDNPAEEPARPPGK